MVRNMRQENTIGAMMIWTRTCGYVCAGGSWVSWRSGYTHDTSPPFGRRWTFCARPKADSHPSIMERSTLTPPSFLPESEDAKKWVWCQEGLVWFGLVPGGSKARFLEQRFYAGG